MPSPRQPAKPVLSSPEAKLLFTLLDAAQDAGLLRGSPLEPRWTALKGQAEPFSKADRAALYALVGELEAAGTLNHTWMLDRWLTVKRRVERAPMDFPTSQAPFPSPGP